MKHVTTWRPDTCGCVIEYEWDDAVNENARTHKQVAAVPCPAHISTASFVDGDAPNVLAKVTTENQTKNKAHSLVLEHFPKVVEETTDADGKKTKQLKAGVEFGWEFDDNRELKVHVKGLTKADHDQLKVLADQTLGIDKVKLK